ncbi:transcription termination/antitermination NusG family protein [Hyphomicrobium sp.]|uniref:transcription termination/antitermination NusG family protein n=1 Tax=Hyphomicrobium sp. TaxID=82 RepID=UPI001D49EC2F|nr:transcription termination/antitermination NusG family protein [Hyphomicrobium sp.]MBY0558653.1 hypothetical protein [Hyphomicrobium sp.]
MNCFVSERGSNAIWIAVSTHPNRERTAAFNLRNQGYDVYVPVIRKQIRHARRVSDVLRPLFPGYLFVCLASTQSRWRPILSTVGVRSVVCTRARATSAEAADENRSAPALPNSDDSRGLRRPLWCDD